LTTLRDKALHQFLLENDRENFYSGLEWLVTPWIDLCVVLHLARRYRPARFLEIGTHRGATTRILADKFPEMQIVTVDPGDQIPLTERPPIQRGEYLPQDQIGDLVRDRPNVTVIRRRFEEVAWNDQRFEMIFVDGNHSLEHVVSDSLLALKLVTSPGVIVWHDFNNVPDVKLALSQLPVMGRIISLHHTWIAYLDTHQRF